MFRALCCRADTDPPYTHLCSEGYQLLEEIPDTFVEVKVVGPSKQRIYADRSGDMEKAKSPEHVIADRLKQLPMLTAYVYFLTEWFVFNYLISRI